VLSRRHATGGCIFVGLGVGLVVILLVRPLGWVEACEVVFVQKLALLIGADRHCWSCVVVEVEWWWNVPKFAMRCAETKDSCLLGSRWRSVGPAEDCPPSTASCSTSLHGKQL
jgi:hypothetical protein